MKINTKITELLCDLSEIETTENSQLLAAEENDLRGNLLQLYRSTDNSASKDTIIAIMTEAGYPWFGKLARTSNETAVTVPDRSVGENTPQFMSDDDFLDLLPINGLFH